MAGMEKCIRMLYERGNELFDDYAGRLADFYRKTEQFNRLCVMKRDDFSEQEVFDLDLSKIVISAKNTNMTGEMLHKRLLHDYALQMEMFSGFYALGMTSIMDREEGFLRLYQALEALDQQSVHVRDDDEKDNAVQALYVPKVKRMNLQEAMEIETRAVSFDEAPGKISGCMVCLYPPGVPLLLPGEAIDADFINNIRKCKKIGLNLQGIADIINEKIDIVNF